VFGNTLMAKGDWWFKFEFGKWRGDSALRRCSLETKGFWIECIAAMREAGTAHFTGTYDEIARLIGCFPEEAGRCLVELKRTGTADVTLGNGDVTVKSRYIDRELKAKELTRLRVARHRAEGECNADVTIQSKSKSKEQEKEEEKREEPATPDVAKRDKPGPKVFLPSDFAITDEMRAWAAREVPRIDIDKHLEEFVNFWREIASRNNRRTLRGWVSTWQNRMKEVQQKNGNGSNQNGNTKSSTNDRLRQTFELAEQYPDEADIIG
jgi:hypothetical protein